VRSEVERRRTTSSLIPTGLKPGDGIIACQGESVACPSSLLRHVLPTEDDHDVELTVRRRQRAEAAEDEEG
jgi:S1-C subfamily serine protease